MKIITTIINGEILEGRKVKEEEEEEEENDWSICLVQSGWTQSGKALPGEVVLYVRSFRNC